MIPTRPSPEVVEERPPPEGGTRMAPGINRLKTWILIAALGGLFVLIGSFWGTNGMVIALVIALVFNFSMYWFSDKIAIGTTRSKPVTEQEMPDYYRIVRGLAQEQRLPMPRLYVSEMMQPNAFATGRNPEHAAVAVTKGILQILDERSEERRVGKECRSGWAEGRRKRVKD